MAAGGKTDMERIGLFSETGYISIEDKYPKLHTNLMPFNLEAYKNRQLLAGGSKKRSATQAGYFDKEFKRIMEKEAFSNYVIMKRRERNLESQKNLAGPFTPIGATKLPSGKGSYYGTFSGNVTAFSPLVRPRKGYEPPGRNFTTNPSKKGTGYGYQNVIIGKPYEHSYDSYSAGREAMKANQEKHKGKLRGGEFKLNLHPLSYFEKNPYICDRAPKSSHRKRPTSGKNVDERPFKPSSPGKRLGGCKAGSFDPYPTHSMDPYKIKTERESVRNKYGQIFRPNAGLKSRPTNSIVNQNVMRSVNVDNFKRIRKVMSY